MNGSLLKNSFSLFSRCKNSYASNSRTLPLPEIKRARHVIWGSNLTRKKFKSIVVKYRVCIIKESWLQTIKIKNSHIYFTESNKRNSESCKAEGTNVLGTLKGIWIFAKVKFRSMMIDMFFFPTSILTSSFSAMRKFLTNRKLAWEWKTFSTRRTGHNKLQLLPN